MSNVTIRQATLVDLDLVAPLFDAYRQFYRQVSDLNAARNFLRARFDHGESIVFIAQDSAEAVGFTQLYPMFSSVSLARVYLLNDLYVAASGRKQGVGTRLLNAAVEYARSLNAVRLMLSTEVSNSTAQAVYEAAGWQREKTFYYYNFQV